LQDGEQVMSKTKLPDQFDVVFEEIKKENTSDNPVLQVTSVNRTLEGYRYQDIFHHIYFLYRGESEVIDYFYSNGMYEKGKGAAFEDIFSQLILNMRTVPELVENNIPTERCLTLIKNIGNNALEVRPALKDEEIKMITTAFYTNFDKLFESKSGILCCDTINKTIKYKPLG
jgi:hypothetical protein